MSSRTNKNNKKTAGDKMTSSIPINHYLAYFNHYLAYFNHYLAYFNQYLALGKKVAS